MNSFLEKLTKKIEKTLGYYLKHWIIYTASIYVILSLYIIHYLHIKREKPTLDIFDWSHMAFIDMFTNPLSIFPLPRGWFNYIIFITGIIGFFFILQTVINHYQRHYDPNTVQGDAQWLKDLEEYNKKFTEPFGVTDNSGKNNMIFSQDIFMSMNNSKIRRNMNVFIIGGSGAGKSFNYVGPNLLQANCSFAITDPSGGLYKEYASFLEYYGYKIKCFNINHMDKSSHYNPFNYIKNDKDIEILVTTLISNTNPPDKQGGDPFWEKSETALLNALIAFLFHYADKEEQNFSNVMKLMLSADIDENDSSSKSPLDMIFDEVSLNFPDSFAVKQYGLFKMGAGKTLKGILISCGVRLQAFSLNDVALLTDDDDIELDRIGDERTALFIILPTGEKTFNFLASLMYSQLFQRVYDYCENSAEFSQLVFDGRGDLIRTYRAEDEIESKEKQKEAEDFLERAKNGEIFYNESYNWWELRTRDVDGKASELVFYRGTKELAEKTLISLREGGKVVPNSSQSNHGQRLPIHLRLMLDEFANIGKIPEFEQKVATIRKYEISVNIILQSLSQMKNLYKDNWSEISGNCDCTIYLGGGADTETTKWISELLGKETRAVVSASFGKSGSMSINRQGVELFTATQLRTMDEDDCIVLLKSTYAYKGKKYKTIDHPEYALLDSLSNYYFNYDKINYLKKNDFNREEDEEFEEDVHGETQEYTEQEKIVQEEQEKAKADEANEYSKNEDIEGNKIIGKAEDVGNSVENIGHIVNENEGTNEEDPFNEEMVTIFEEELVYSSTGGNLGNSNSY